ncbi:hypothetical protein PIB30_035710, partial [Stylosanthes scabra]|nr:hypothetical protein [Stylosanthes scabra]
MGRQGAFLRGVLGLQCKMGIEYGCWFCGGGRWNAFMSCFDAGNGITRRRRRKKERKKTSVWCNGINAGRRKCGHWSELTDSDHHEWIDLQWLLVKDETVVKVDILTTSSPSESDSDSDEKDRRKHGKDKNNFDLFCYGLTIA